MTIAKVRGDGPARRMGPGREEGARGFEGYRLPAAVLFTTVGSCIPLHHPMNGYEDLRFTDKVPSSRGI